MLRTILRASLRRAVPLRNAGETSKGSEKQINWRKYVKDLGPDPPSWARYLRDTEREYTDAFSRHRTVARIAALEPTVNDTAFVDRTASIVGRVEVWQFTTIYPRVVIRGDVNLIRIGAYTNIQEGTVITESFDPLNDDHDGSTIVGHYVTISPNCSLHACTIEPFCLVGTGSILESGSYLEEGSMLLPGSVLKSNSRTRSNEIWSGNPAKFLRRMTFEDRDRIEDIAVHNSRLNLVYKEEYDYLPSIAHLDAEFRGWKETGQSILCPGKQL